jgi:hypothetical protein
MQMPAWTVSVLALPALLALAAAPGGAAEEGEGPAWPLEGVPAISSNFCEYREGHFHAGLDIRTYGAEGVPCVAAGDGYVSRMRASPEGYGKALYIRLDSGETLVYAHLAEFDTALERALYEAQQREGGYSVDVRLPRGRYPVRRGDVIAWSGSTGGIPPHLHFEVRDGGENPLNPLLNGFALEDLLAPEFERIEFTPLGPVARINGHCWPVQCRARRVGEGRFTVGDTLVFSGPVGVAVEVFDLLNRRSGRLAPHRVTLEVEDSLVADIRLERFSFAQDDQVDFLFDIARVRSEHVFMIQLFRSAGEILWNRTFLRGGALAAAPAPGDGIRRGTITATDAAGNSATLTFAFYDGDSRPLRPRDWENAPLGLDTAVPGVFCRDGFVSTRHPIPDARLERGHTLPSDRAISDAIPGYRHPNVYTAAELGDGPVELPARLSGAAGSLYLFGVKGGTPTSVSFADLGLQLVFGRQTLYADAVVYATSWSDTGGQVNPGELIPKSDCVLIGPYSATLRSDMEIRFSAGGFDSLSAIYRLNERKGEWVFYESAAERGSVRTTARRPGVYGVFDDRYGPRIRKPFVKLQKSYATGRRRPALVIPIEDTGSGLDHEKTSVSVDGVEQIAYWNSRAKKMFVVVRDPNIMGPRVISVVAYDNIGNRSQLDASVEIPVTSQSRGKD